MSVVVGILVVMGFFWVLGHFSRPRPEDTAVMRRELDQLRADQDRMRAREKLVLEHLMKTTPHASPRQDDDAP